MVDMSHVKNTVGHRTVPRPTHRSTKRTLAWQGMSEHNPERIVAQPVALDLDGPFLLKLLNVSLNKHKQRRIRSLMYSGPRRRKLDIKSDMLTHHATHQLNNERGFGKWCGRRSCR